MNPIPGVTNDSLGFCLGKISGDEKTLFVEKRDDQNALISEVELNVTAIGPDAI